MYNLTSGNISWKKAKRNVVYACSRARLETLETKLRNEFQVDVRNLEQRYVKRASLQTQQ